MQRTSVRARCTSAKAHAARRPKTQAPRHVKFKRIPGGVAPAASAPSRSRTRTLVRVPPISKARMGGLRARRQGGGATRHVQRARDVCNGHGHILIIIIGMHVGYAPSCIRHQAESMQRTDALARCHITSDQRKSHLPPLRRSRARGSEFTVASPGIRAFAFEHVCATRMMANNRGPDILT